jgi:photosystem II stability/assembly factor-like uncharacterized protein
MIRHFCCIFLCLFSLKSIAQGNISIINSGTKEHFRSVFFVDSKIGFIVGNNGTILNTIDGGKTWNAVPSDFKDFLYDIDFHGKNVGYTVGGDFENEAVILKTSDGGKSWKIIHKIDSVNALLSVQAINEKIVYTVGYNGAILKTQNGGNTWNKLQSPNKERFQGLSFVNEQTGWVVGTKGTILFTKDGGKSWQVQNSGVKEHLESVHFLNNRVGYATGNNGVIIATKDGGKTWVRQKSYTSEPLHAVKFINENVGWAVGGYLCNGKIPTIVHTSNGGETWRSNESPILIPLNGIFFNNEQQGFIVGLQGTLMKVDLLNVVNNQSVKVKKNEVSNFPNPFTDETTIRYYLEENSDVDLKIFNMIGEEVLSFHLKDQEKGYRQIVWDGKLKNGKQAPTGLYYYKIKVKNRKEEIEETRRMVMVK